MPESRILFFLPFFRKIRVSGGAEDEAKGFSYIFNQTGTHSGNHSLIELKNSLIAQGRYMDAVDDVLIKITKARRKHITVRYI